VALDDVLIVQSQGRHTGEGISLGSNEFALGAHASYTVEWAIYVNNSGDYYEVAETLATQLELKPKDRRRVRRIIAHYIRVKTQER